jgi:hypothetical protein
VSLPHEADWIRYAGVTIALAGVLIATPDGVVEVWRYARLGGRWARIALARFLPFLGKSANVMGVAAEVAAAADAVTVVKRREWEPNASDTMKVEILHQQVDFLIEEVESFKSDVTGRLAAVRQDLQQAEARLSAAHGQLARALEAKDRRAAQIDARGLWPIGFGILLTGIPGELADVAAVGVLVTASAAVVTAELGWSVLRSRAKDHAAGSPNAA